MRTRQNRSGAIAAVLITCVACSNDGVVQDSPAPGTGRVVVYSTLGENVVKPVFDAYAAETGTTVSLVTGAFQSLSRKVDRPGGGPIADLFIARNSVELWEAAEQGIFRSTRSEKIDSQVAPRLRGPERLWVSIATELRGVIYNSDLASDAELNTIVDYASLAAERWRKRLCLSSSGVGDNSALIAMLINDNGVRDAEIIVRGWRANLAAAVYADDRSLLGALEAGQCAIGIAGSGEMARHLISVAETSVAPHWFPDSAVMHVNATGAGVTRHARNPDGAESLLEWLTSDSGNGLIAARLWRFPVNPGSDTASPIAAWSEHGGNPATLASLGFLLEDAAKLAERARYP